MGKNNFNIIMDLCERGFLYTITMNGKIVCADVPLERAKRSFEIYKQDLDGYSITGDYHDFTE